MVSRLEVLAEVLLKVQVVGDVTPLHFTTLILFTKIISTVSENHTKYIND
jgi:hypothetical protein